MRLSIASLLCGAVMFAALSSAPASASPTAAASASAELGTAVSAEQVQYYYYERPRRYYAGPRYYEGPRYYGRPGYVYRERYRRRDDGVAAGLAAGAIGALAIGGLAASGAFDAPAAAPMAPPRRQWCADRYRSYNPADGTFIDRNGRVRYCG